MKTYEGFFWPENDHFCLELVSLPSLLSPLEQQRLPCCFIERWTRSSCGAPCLSDLWCAAFILPFTVILLAGVSVLLVYKLQHCLPRCPPKAKKLNCIYESEWGSQGNTECVSVYMCMCVLLTSWPRDAPSQGTHATSGYMQFAGNSEQRLVMNGSVTYIA